MSLSRQSSLVYTFAHQDLDGVSASYIYSNFCMKLSVAGRKFVPMAKYGTIDGPNSINGKITSVLNRLAENKEKHRSRFVEPSDFIIMDITPSLAILTKIMTEFQHTRLLLIDHHELTQEYRDFCKRWEPTGRFIDGVKYLQQHMEIDLDHESAASLTAKYIELVHDFYDQDLRDYIEAVRGWDTWDWQKDPSFKFPVEAQILNICCSKFGPVPFLHRFVAGQGHVNYIQNILTPFERLYGKEKLGRLEGKKKACLKKAVVKDMWIGQGSASHSYSVAVLTCNKDQSEIGNYILHNHPDHPKAVIMYNNGSVSIRTLSGTDAVELAKKFNGGGHPEAAGGYKDPNLVNYIENVLADKI